MAPQHDYILDNQNGAQFRADLNLALEAIATVNSGAVAPTTTYAYQYWADTTSGYLKQRDASNADWIVRGKLAADYGQAGQVLTSAGADEPAIWTSITEDGAWTVAEDATNSHYTFTGNGFDGTETNPTIYVTRGSVYNFTNADTVNGFQIQSVAGLGGAAYTDGTVNNPALAPNTSTVETLVWTVQMDAPSELYYHSTTNAGPGGKIYVLNNIPSSIAATPEIVLEDSLGATAGIEQTAFIRDNDEFKIQTRSATDVLVSTDYNVTLGTSGATSHQWSIDNTEAVRIDSSNNVGIGVSSPAATLQVQNNSGTPGGNIQRWTADLGTNTRSATLLAPEIDNITDPFVFFTNSSWKFRVDTIDALTIADDGNVGIGATNPTELLHLSQAGPQSILLERTDGAPSESKFSNESSCTIISDNLNGIQFRTGATPTEVARINADGHLGIGVSNPSQTLVVEDDVSSPIQVAVRSTQTSTTCRLGVGSTGNSVGVFADNTVLESRSGGLSIGTNNAGSDVTIYTAGTRTPRLTVKSDGIVNIANAPTYADDTAAGTGGLVAGDVYKTSTGELRIKL